MKKMIKIAICILLLSTLVACTTDTQKDEEKSINDTITISVENGENKMIDIQVPLNPLKIVVVDYVALDMIDSWGLGDRVVGAPKSGPPAHLQKYVDDESVVNLGGLKEIDMEAIMSLQPDIIFTSGRTASRYDEFSMIAPTVMTSIDYEKGFVASFEEMVMRNARIFGLEGVAIAQLAEFDERISVLKTAAKDKTAIVGITSGGSLSTLGNGSRGSIIGTDIGFLNIANDVDSSHGNTASFELLVELDADYIFILDRDTAISTDGSATAQQLMDNELVHKTNAYKNNNIVYLTPSVWYLAEGGITSMDIMLKDIEYGILTK